MRSKQDSRESEADALRRAVERLHACKAELVERVPVDERFQGQPVWQGHVHVFDIQGNRLAKRCYAWAAETDAGKRKTYAVLAVPPVKTAADAVRASIVADHRKAGG